MNLAEALSKPKPCRICRLMIPAGSLLSTLSWDRGERAWAHRAPSCAELRATPPIKPPASLPGPTCGSSGASGSDPGPAQGPEGVPDDPGRGAWSVTLEIHDAADPARSKRVLRLARLHLGTYAEACAVAEQVRKIHAVMVGREEGGPDRPA